MHYTILYASIIEEMKCLTQENLDINRDDVQAGNNENSLKSSASVERRHVREMSDVAKREMGEFSDDVGHVYGFTAFCWDFCIELLPPPMTFRYCDWKSLSMIHYAFFWTLWCILL